MIVPYNSNEKPVMLKISVATKAPEKIRVKVYDPNYKNTFYTDRYHIVKPSKSDANFYVRMPISPATCAIEVFNEKFGPLPLGKDPTFQVKQITPMKLPRKIEGLAFMKGDVGEAIEFYEKFSTQAGWCSASVPAIGKNQASPKSSYFSKSGKFRIDFYEIIRDENGKPLKTPARISITRGVIEVSAYHFRKYTVPQRMAILCHEYSHFYENSDMHDEIEADLNGLIIYLGLGFPRIEARQVFLEVFKGSPSDLNRKRDEILEKFIDQFDNISLNSAA